MELALPRIRGLDPPEGLRVFATWAACWILLPNLGFWLLLIVGGPPRPVPVVATGLLGILTHRMPFPVRFAAFLAAAFFSALWFVAASFNLGIPSLLDSLRFAGELSPAASPEYLAAAFALALTLFAAWRLLQRPAVLGRPALLLAAAAATAGAAWADSLLSRGALGSYGRTPAAGAPFSSAVAESGLDRLATGKRHVLMVMAEAMGDPADPALRRRLVDLWARPEVRARYDVTVGSSPFYGSTTLGEMRELCGRWADYGEVMEKKDPSCLPARLAARGYRTSAWHSFAGSFFDRTSWYPNIGFGEMRFAPELRRRGAAPCPGVFPGACDRDVPRQLGAALRQAREPSFLYWLTVNSHLPVLENRHLQTERCARFDPALDAGFPMTCRLFQLFDQTGAALAREIAAPDFPATDILIVGDHIPPFFDRRHREQFAPDTVLWILLRPKGARPA